MVGRCNRRGDGVLFDDFSSLEFSLLGSVRNFRKDSGLLKIVRTAAASGLIDSGDEEQRT